MERKAFYHQRKKELPNIGRLGGNIITDAQTANLFPQLT